MSLITTLYFACKKDISEQHSMRAESLELIAKTEQVTIDQQRLRSVDDWETLFQNVWSYEYTIAKAQSTSNDSWQFYNLAYSIDANTTMFQATGKTKYLDRAFYYINNVIDSAKPSHLIPTSQFKDNYLGWSNYSHPDMSLKGKEVPLFESFCWRYVTTLLRIIKNSPLLLFNPKYSRQYQKVLSFTQKHIFNKWYSRGTGNIYRSRTHIASHWARISMDLWNITSNTKYLKVFTNFNHSLPNYNSSMRKQIKPHPLDPLAYWWNDEWNNFLLPGQDVSHGNAVIGMIVEAKDICQEYTEKDINALIRTFNIVWPSNVFPTHIDGSRPPDKEGGWFNDGFIKLGRYDASVQRKIESHNTGRNTQLYGNGALNARILLYEKPHYPTNSCKYKKNCKS